LLVVMRGMIVNREWIPPAGLMLPCRWPEAPLLAESAARCPRHFGCTNGFPPGVPGGGMIGVRLVRWFGGKTTLPSPLAGG